MEYQKVAKKFPKIQKFFHLRIKSFKWILLSLTEDNTWFICVQKVKQEIHIDSNFLQSHELLDT